MRSIWIYWFHQEEFIAEHQMVSRTVWDVDVGPRKVNENPTREISQRKDTAVTEPDHVASLLKSGLPSRYKMQGIAFWTSGEPRPVMADPELGYLDENDDPNRVHTTLWCL